MHRLHNYSCATSLRISVKPFSNYNTNCKITILYIKHTCQNVTVCALITSESAFSSYQHFAFFIGQFWKNWISAYMWFKMHFTLFKEKWNKNNPNNAIYLGDFYGGGGGGGGVIIQIVLKVFLPLILYLFFFIFFYKNSIKSKVFIIFFGVSLFSLCVLVDWKYMYM